MTNLYRREVGEHLRGRIAGDVLLAVPLPHSILSASAVALAAVAITFAALASYTSREQVVGWLTPHAGLIRLSPPASGTVERLFVQEGGVVAANQIIALVRTDRVSASGAVGERLVQATATEERASLAREAAQTALLQAERRQVAARLRTLRKVHLQTLERIALQTERVRLAREGLERAEPVMRAGYLSASQFEARQNALLVAQDGLEQLRSTALGEEQSLTDLQEQLGRIPKQLASLKADASAMRAGIAQRRINAEAEGVTAIHAPVAGRVLALPRGIGQAADPSSPIVIMAPGNSGLEAELYVPSRAIGFVRRGQAVRLKYEAFPFQRFGVGSGHVRSISSTVLPPDEAALAGVKVDEPVFRVRVALDRQAVTAYGQAIPLQPGMLLSADVVTDRRSLLSLLMDPIRMAART